MSCAEEVQVHVFRVEGKLGKGVTAKDIALAIIGRIGTAGGTGYAIEFGGSTIRGLSMEARMTLCNMAIEAGARMGFIGVDELTIEYLKGRPFAPRPISGKQLPQSGGPCAAMRPPASTAGFRNARRGYRAGYLGDFA